MPGKPKKITPTMKKIAATLVEHPDWSQAQVADHLEVRRETVNRNLTSEAFREYVVELVKGRNSTVALLAAQQVVERILTDRKTPAGVQADIAKHVRNSNGVSDAAGTAPARGGISVQIVAGHVEIGSDGRISAYPERLIRANSVHSGRILVGEAQESGEDAVTTTD